MADFLGTANNDTLNGGTGNDRLFGKGGHDKLYGGDGIDLLEGNEGNDSLVGGAGNDILDGGTGNDTMLGGANDDTYYVDSLQDQVIEVDGAGRDTVITTLSQYALGAFVENGTITFGGAAVLTGNGLDNTLIVSGGNDSVYGGAGKDYLLGQGGNDYLSGGEGNDQLNGGSGSNILEGGSGDDDYVIVDWAVGQTQLIIEAADGGYDRVTTTGVGGAGSTGAAGELHGFVMANGVEEVVTTGNFAFNLTGNAGNNTMTAGQYADTLDGGAGADTMYGHGGADVYVIDNAGDRALFETLNYAQKDTARIVSAVNWTMDPGIERVQIWVGNATVTGTAYDDEIYGSTDSDWVYGGGGADSLFGGGGADWLDGGSGNDHLSAGSSATASTLTGGAGDDHFYLWSKTDQVIELAGEGFDTAHIYADWVVAENVELTLVESAFGLKVTGNDAANTIKGGAGADLILGGLGNDLLDGGLMGDTLVGGAGNDTYQVNSGSDVVTELVGEGMDTVHSSVNHVLAANVEALVLTGGALIGTGNALRNTITAGAGNQTLKGMGGNDTITGGQGADMLRGGVGRDVFVFGSGDSGTGAGQTDTIADFLTGTDRIDLRSMDSNAADENHNPLIFLGTDAFTNHAGEMRYEALPLGGLRLLIDENGDGTADMAIEIQGSASLTLTDFML